MTTEIILKPQKRISPSSINTFEHCPRKYYFSYIDKKPKAKTIHLLKGSIVHRVLEIFFGGYKKDGKKYIIELFKKEWVDNKEKLKQLELPAQELHLGKKDAYKMIINYYNKYRTNANDLIEAGKAENERHAFFLLKPQIKELWVEDVSLHCGGFIDRIHKDFDGVVTLGDYKTGKKYGIGLPRDARRQISIYGLLYVNQTQVVPDFVSIIFLRYGEEYLLEVTPSLLKYARNTILEVWGKTRSVDLSDYPKKEGKLCGWCDFFTICSGEKKHKKGIRQKKMKELIKNVKNK